MSDTENTTPTTFQASMRSATVNAAGSVGAVAGVFIGLAIVGTVLEKVKSRKNPEVETD
jgi:hypothetical protein